MQAQAQRILRPGTEYNSLFAGVPSANDSRLVKSSAGIPETMELVQRMARQYAGQTARLAPRLRRPTLNGTLKAIWDFVYHHIQYRLDEPGQEQVRRPVRTWQDRAHGVDCEDYTVFISTILSNLSIPHKLRIAAYQRGWQHIYVVVPKDGNIERELTLDDRDAYHVLDCVMDQYDDEFPPTQTRDYSMSRLSELGALSGTGDSPMTIDALTVSALGAIEPRIVATYVSTSGHTIGIDQAGNTYVYEQDLNGLGGFFSKLGGAIKNVGTAVVKGVVQVNSTVGTNLLPVVTGGLVSKDQAAQVFDVRNALLPKSFQTNVQQSLPQVQTLAPSAPAPSVIDQYFPSQPQLPAAPQQQYLPAPAQPLVPPPPPNVPVSTTPAARQPNDPPADPWYKNPVYVGGAAIAVLGIGFLALRKPAGGLSGTPRKRRKAAGSSNAGTGSTGKKKKKGSAKKITLTPLR